MCAFILHEGVTWTYIITLQVLVIKISFISWLNYVLRLIYGKNTFLLSCAQVSHCCHQGVTCTSDTLLCYYSYLHNWHRLAICVLLTILKDSNCNDTVLGTGNDRSNLRVREHYLFSRSFRSSVCDVTPQRWRIRIALLTRSRLGDVFSSCQLSTTLTTMSNGRLKWLDHRK